MNFDFQRHKSPIGMLRIVAKDEKLYGIIFDKNWPDFTKIFIAVSETETPIIKKAKQQLDEYFQGKRKLFNLPYELRGTDFQNRVWSALASIPYGQTRTYKEQAVSMETPNSARPVGRTNGLNPLSIILPCHRVVGSNGKLTGYAGGLKAKKFLLDLEQGKL